MEVPFSSWDPLKDAATVELGGQRHTVSLSSALPLNDWACHYLCQHPEVLTTGQALALAMACTEQEENPSLKPHVGPLYKKMLQALLLRVANEPTTPAYTRAFCLEKLAGSNMSPPVKPVSPEAPAKPEALKKRTHTPFPDIKIEPPRTTGTPSATSPAAGSRHNPAAVPSRGDVDLLMRQCLHALRGHEYMHEIRHGCTYLGVSLDPETASRGSIQNQFRQLEQALAALPIGVLQTLAVSQAMTHLFCTLFNAPHFSTSLPSGSLADSVRLARERVVAARHRPMDVVRRLLQQCQTEVESRPIQQAQSAGEIMRRAALMHATSGLREAYQRSLPEPAPRRNPQPDARFRRFRN